MKRLTFFSLLVLALSPAFAAWHKADLYLNDGSVSRLDVKLPDETFSGLFSRSVTVKQGDNESLIALKNINKLILSNGLTFVKYDNNGHPVLLKQITQYAGVNILILETNSSPGLVESDHYIYRVSGTTTYENQPIGYDIQRPDNLMTSSVTNNFGVNDHTYTGGVVGAYFSAVTQNGRLYSPSVTDYIYLMKGDKIERLLGTQTYASLNELMGDDKNIAAGIKQGVASFQQLTQLVALYNADRVLN